MKGDNVCMINLMNVEPMVLVPLLDPNLNSSYGCGCGVNNGCGSGGDCLCGGVNGGGQGQCPQQEAGV
jgi:hypothetical protein